LKIAPPNWPPRMVPTIMPRPKKRKTLVALAIESPLFSLRYLLMKKKLPQGMVPAMPWRRRRRFVRFLKSPA